jgi:hypothetical protein
MFILPATVIVSVFLAFASGIDETGLMAFRDLFQSGYSRATLDSRTAFNESVQYACLFYVGLWLLAMAGAAGSSITVEREEDTWVSLTATPLTGREILWGKLLGTAWSLRGFIALPGLLWLAALVTGALHPVGFLVELAVLGLFTAFSVSTGLYFSLRSRTTSRALAATLALLIGLNVLPPLLLVPFGIPGLSRAALVVFYTPRLICGAGWSPQALQKLFVWWREGTLWNHGILPCGLVGLYGAGTALFVHKSIQQFDRLLDRPPTESVRESIPRVTRAPHAHRELASETAHN